MKDVIILTIKPTTDMGDAGFMSVPNGIALTGEGLKISRNGLLPTAGNRI